jgi:hypothetical protein
MASVDVMTSDDLRLPLTKDDLSTDPDPLCKWCCIYMWLGIVVLGGIIALVYFFWH